MTKNKKILAFKWHCFLSMTHIDFDILNAIFIGCIFIRLYVFVSVTSQRSCKHQNCGLALRTKLRRLMCVCLRSVPVSRSPPPKLSQASLPTQRGKKAKNKKSVQQKCDGSGIHFLGSVPGPESIMELCEWAIKLKGFTFLMYSYKRAIHLKKLCLLSLSTANSRPRCYI